MNEDPLKLAQLKEAPMKSLDDLFSSGKNENLITVEKKVLMLFIVDQIALQLLYLLCIVNFRLILVV
jgi:hypothetical protein